MNAPTRRTFSAPIITVLTCLSVSVVVACAAPPAGSVSKGDDLTAGDTPAKSDGKSPSKPAASASPSPSPSAPSNASTPPPASGTTTSNPGTAGSGQCQPDPPAPPGNEPEESACIKCCDAANPAAATILKQWSSCLDACGDNPTEACMAACDTTEEAACKSSGGACDRLQACEDICDPPDTRKSDAPPSN